MNKHTSMKTRIFILIGVFIAACGLFWSCNKSTSDATPVVRFVRPIDAKQSDKLLTSVSMGGNVAIIGEGLADVVKIAFNDQYCKLNPTMITATSIICQVPSTMPQEITNKMYLTTRSGKTAEFEISVIIPSPFLDTMDCLYAPEGSQTTINGKYFFAKEDGTIDVVFPGQIAAEVVSFTETQIVIKVPAGADIEGPVSVTSAYGTSRSAFNWHCTEGLFEDFTTTDNVTWGTGRFDTADACSGQYLDLYGGVGSWAWPANEIQLFWLNPTHQPLLSEGEPNDYALEFEYNCHKWDCTPMLFWFNGDVEEQNVDGTDAQYHWRLYETGFTPDVWRTIRIPLSEFNTSKDESETRHIAGFEDMVNFHMMPFGAADGAGEIDINIDNLRLVKIN